ncbi:restriction endonuclease subunit S [Aeribacillus sp. FSL M8-0254]|uniref:restriction endonuclease subunit S n=1 Tax=Aeribacillus sp. FSL M8-0254 TaxID=2954577 RepID=UPI0030F97ED6
MSKKKQKLMEELLEEALVPEEEQPYPLPKNWVWTRLGNVVDFINGDRGKGYPSKKDFVQHGIPFINAGHLESGNINMEKMNYISNEKYDSLRSGKVINNDVLYCLRGTLGKAAIVRGIDKGAIASSLVILRPNNDVNNSYLYFYLISGLGKSMIEIHDNGSAQPNLSVNNVKKFIFPLPPKYEQKRIAEKIERLFAKIDEAKRLIEEVKESFELQWAAILDKAFKGQLGTNDPNEKSMLETSNDIKEKDLIPKEEQPYEVPKNWVWVKTGAIFEQIKEQVLPVGNETYVGLEHLIKGGGISHTELAKDIKSKKVVFKKGDVLYGKLRPYLNKHAVVDFDGVASTDILVLRTEHKYLNQLLDYYLGLPSTIDYAVSNSNGINLPRVSPKKMNDLPFPLPPKNEWKRIVKILDKMLNNLIEEQTLIEQLEAELISLKNSILYKAFRGELGTNDPTDEHAIELLKEVLKSK